MASRAPLHLLACGHAADLADAVARHLDIEVSPSHDVWFACGEAKHVIDTNVRGGDVYIFQRPAVPGDPRSIYDLWMMAMHAADAARCADAERVTVVVPYLPGSRQDKRKGHIREGVSTGLFARMVEAAGIDMVVTVEPHNEAIIGCYQPSIAVLEPLSIARPFAVHLSQSGIRHEVVASTDVGGLEMARQFARALDADLAALSKERDYRQANTVIKTDVIGDVEGRAVLIVDDILDTGGSVVAAVHALWDAGATDVTIAAVHALMSGPAWQRLGDLETQARGRGSRLRVMGTSSILHPDAPSWYMSFPIETLLAEVVRSVNQRGSVRALE